MSTIQTEGDGEGIDAPIDVPVPDVPGFDLDEIVEAASQMIERDMRRTPVTTDEPVDEPTDLDTADDDADTAGDNTTTTGEADTPSDVDDADDEGAQAGSDPGEATRPQPGSGPAGEPTDIDDTPPPDDTTTEPASEWDRVGDAFERLHGVRPTFDQLQDLTDRAARFDGLVTQLQSLPPDQQQIVADIVEGRFDPVEYARRVAPPVQHDPHRDPLFDDDPTPTAPQSDDAVVRELRELRAMQERQRQDEWTRNVQSDLERLQADFFAANPDLPIDQFEQIAQSVHKSGKWVNDINTRGAYDAYARHLIAHATAAGLDVRPPGQVAAPASAPTPTPTPTPAPSKAAAADAPLPPLTPEEEAHATRRQAASGALAGSSAPARSRGKRSVLDSAAEAGHPQRPKTGQDLQAALEAAAAEMGLGQ